jgi:hypothetical protein
MSRSSSGTKKNPGKNVAAKSGLNKAILDQGWYEFRRQVEYTDESGLLGRKILKSYQNSRIQNPAFYCFSL